MLRVKLKSLLVAFEGRLERGFVFILVQDDALVVPKLGIHVSVKFLGH